MREKAKILVIDDETLVRQSIVAFLEDSGYRLCEATNGEEGVEVFVREQPDLVMTDMRMPKVDGLGVITAIRALNARVPIFSLSGMGDVDVDAIRRGANLAVAKPILDLAELVGAIEAALATYRS